MPNEPWFRPKDFGTGYTPNTWQGWLITFGVIVLFLAGTFVMLARLMTGRLT
jgi:hypothetical protein